MHEPISRPSYILLRDLTWRLRSFFFSLSQVPLRICYHQTSPFFFFFFSLLHRRRSAARRLASQSSLSSTSPPFFLLSSFGIVAAAQHARLSSQLLLHHHLYLIPQISFPQTGRISPLAIFRLHHHTFGPPLFTVLATLILTRLILVIISLFDR